MSDPMTIQHGGNHYKGFAIEPFEITMANRYDGAIHSIVKYVARHGAKNGAEDLWKAHHIADIRRVQIVRWGTEKGQELITMDRFVDENHIDPVDAEILRATHEWHLDPYIVNGEDYCTLIRRLLEQRIATQYPN